MTRISRRRVLQTSISSAAVLSFGGLAPAPLAVAASRDTTGRILVVIELAGGNDGLNTVVPYANNDYYKARPELAIPKSDVLQIDDHAGFHPSLRGFADLLEAGRLTVVQGVGYPDPNRSHFESMDIWHTCRRKNETRSDGWIGRYFESRLEASNDPAGIHLGHDKQPFALMSRSIRVPSIQSLEQFRLQGTENAEFKKAVTDLADARRGEGDGLLNFVQSSTSSAIAASDRLVASGKSYVSSIVYPTTQLGSQLQTVARLIATGLQTSVYYVQLNGFDTHSQQPDAHRGLLRQLGDAVKAFVDDIDDQKQLDRVMVMAFSEFGRRVEQNASDGTDHGTAGPMFLAGNLLKPGLVGNRPNLGKLKDGDLVHDIDFRQVYASLLQNWFKADSSTILYGDFKPVDVFRA